MSIFLTQNKNIGPKMLLGPCSTQLKTVFDVLESNTIRLTTFKLIFMTLGGQNSIKIAKTQLFLRQKF